MAHIPFDRNKFLEPALEQLKGKTDLDDVSYRDLPFRPVVVDSGVKRSSEPHSSHTRRRGARKRHFSPKDLWTHLTQPRLIQVAKKRRIEISSQDRISALLCLLVSPQEERLDFSEFLGRHESSDSFFGECVDWKMNIWQTELHLAFYRLIDAEGKDRTTLIGSNFGGALRTRNIPSLLGALHARKIAPVVSSFRFVGDLRDRIWTCTFISSATSSDGFEGFSHAGEWRHDWETISAEEQAQWRQRRLLELSYVEKKLIDMSLSIGSILDVFQRELDVPESRNPQSESFEFIYNYSTLYLKSGEILRDVWQRVESSVQTVELWERREEIRGLRSRWSSKDEERYGKGVKDLTQKCKARLQEIRVQHKRLDEQRTFADQRHSNLVSYMQLREARSSTRSAEDVRLFTYVTIIFLPLSFSSSLFSMQAAPQASTISIMIQTTVVALTITILFLSNLRTLDRNWNFYLNKLNSKALTRMKASEHPWALDWHKKQIELEEVAQRRIYRMDYAKPLQAESKWWYFLFWLTYALRLPRVFVLDGIAAWNKRQKISLHLISQMLLALCFSPVCVVIFLIQFSSVTAVDSVVVVWLLACTISNRFLGLSQSEQDRAGLSDQDKRKDDEEKSPGARFTFETISKWLRSPPRPFHTMVHRLKAGQSRAALPQPTAPTDQSPEPSNNTQGDDDKAWALAINDESASDNEKEASAVEMSEPVATESNHSGVAIRNSSQLEEIV
ncbi:MAG: hypothetical protein Q9214_000396 [Letrouitia sp. 1 TL-2023]